LCSVAVTDSCANRPANYGTRHGASTDSLTDGYLLCVLVTFRQVDTVLHCVDATHIDNRWVGEGLLRTCAKCGHKNEKKTTKHQILLGFLDV
jgi:hypothetical protein